MLPTFVALDFETANSADTSACALGIVRVEKDQITQKKMILIRPPSSFFPLTRIHGISWKQVQDQPTFAQVWPTILPMLKGASFLAAHSASFDQKVLKACCESAKFLTPNIPFVCTLRLSRRVWPLPSYSLPSLCKHLDIPLEHHHALSDAEACARILLSLPWGQQVVLKEEFSVKKQSPLLANTKTF